MSDRNEAKHQSFPWSALVATAAVGVLAYVVAKRVKDQGALSASNPLSDVLNACDKAVEALEGRVRSGVGMAS